MFVDCIILIWDGKMGKKLCMLGGYIKEVICIVWSLIGNCLIIILKDYLIIVWDIYGEFWK